MTTKKLLEAMLIGLSVVLALKLVDWLT